MSSNPFDDVAESAQALIFSFLDLLEISKSLSIVNKQFNFCIRSCCTYFGEIIVIHMESNRCWQQNRT